MRVRAPLGIDQVRFRERDHRRRYLEHAQDREMLERLRAVPERGIQRVLETADFGRGSP